VNAASPAFLLDGEMLVVVGAGLFTVRVCAFDVPPPGAGFVTVMLKVPAVVRSVAGMDAVTCVALTKVVVREEPSKLTTEAVTKLVPFTVSVNPASPTFLLVGKILVVVGTGLFTVNVCAFEMPPPGAGFVTVILNVPAVVRSLAGIVAVNLMLLTNVVVRADPAKLTTDVETKFVPFTVSVRVAAPAVALTGEMLVVVGTGLFTVRTCAFDVPPPGAAFTTVTLNVPATATSAAVIAAVTCVAVTKVVVRGEPLKLTTDPATKFVPFTVRVNAASPAVFVAGEMVVVVGTGLLTVRVCALDVPPPGAGFVTVMLNVPAVATSAAVIAAVNWTALTNVVVRAAPLKLTTEVETKLVPFTVSVNATSPAFLLDGEMLVVVGSRLSTVRVCAFDVPPPGAGFATVMLKVPAVVRSVARIAAVN
jgi:hypothetical protein